MDIGRFHARMNPKATVTVRSAISASFRLLGLYPEIGRLQQDRSLRKLVVPRFGYLIYYRVDRKAGVVAIVTIRHASRAREFDDA